MRYIILIMLCWFFTWQAAGQSDSTKAQGEIISGEVVVEKDNKIVLPMAEKIFLRSNTNTLDTSLLQIDFQINEPLFEWPNYKSDVPFQTAVENYPHEKFQNYVKFGFGNYSSPLLEAGFFKKFNQFETNARVFYESFKSGPVNGDNSDNSDGGIELSGTYKKNSIAIIPRLKYTNQQYSFYGNANRVNNGFDSSKPDDNSLNDFVFDVALTGTKGDVSYSITPNFSFTNQSISPQDSGNKESSIGADASLSYKIDEKFNTGFDIDANSASYDGGIQIDRSLVNVKPWVTHKVDKLSIKAGFVISSGKVGDGSKTGFYPDLSAKYELNSDWSVYGLLSGGQKWNSLSSTLNENQFLDDSLTIVHLEYVSSFGGGIKGKPYKNILLDVGLTFNSVKGLPFYTPSSSDSSRYTLSFDSESVGIVTLSSSISFMPTSISSYGLKLDINSFSVESLDKPWHKPTYVIQAFTSHNIQEKLIISAYFTSIGGLRGPANVDFGSVKLSSFIDIGVSAKYLITKQVSAFITANNLLNDEYERYLGYPIRGLSFKLGGQYRF